MPPFQLFEDLEIGAAAFPAAELRCRMKTHQLLYRAKHDGLQSVASFAVRDPLQALRDFLRTREATLRGCRRAPAGSAGILLGIEAMMSRGAGAGCDPAHVFAGSRNVRR
jgi:hypothetical protein